MDNASHGQVQGGLIVLGVGVIFLLSNLGYIPDMGDMWPLFPIVVGIALIVGGLMRKGKRPGSPSTPPPGQGSP